MTTINDYHWSAVTIQRPYEPETVCDILTHLASLTSRGPVVWEARCRGGKVRFLLGTTKKSVGRVQEVFKAHADVQFTDAGERSPATDARKIKITKPMLSLNTEVSAAMTRATLAAMAGAKLEEETVVQMVLGASHAPSAIPKNMANPNASWLDVILGSAQHASPELRRNAKEKADQYSFETVLRIGMTGDQTTTRLNNIVSAMRTLESAGVHIRADQERPEHLNNAVLPWRMPLRLSVKKKNGRESYTAAKGEKQQIWYLRVIMPQKRTKALAKK